ncbi:MAG: N-6 DNA methylase, partial [Candidatus Roizmanbacteria bacterium]|nr:N-6 DNA methylase [Candidatus Roizmanbacteria bacterium]
LGQVYERFLGKVIRLTAGHQAKVEEKPEVRKAGGVYYTPTFIVDYIVINTLGKLLDPSPGPSPDPTPDPPSATLRDASRSPDGKHVRRGETMTPRQAAGLKILDPACGSGTFLLSAYQYLLDWHLKWYMEHEPGKWATGKNPTIYQATDGHRLTTSKKKEILLNNIFGVDIDPQAVEVTKLSLLLKVLEGESNETIGSQLALFQERVLPDLGRNIQCGNSLIGPDYYEGHQLTMSFADEEERYRVNAFNWKAEFAQVFIQGGFDVVIGNPPWAFTKYVDWGEETKIYIQQKYLSSRANEAQSRARQAGKINLFAVFTLMAIGVLKQRGLFSFILPNNILRTTVYDIVRKQLLENTKFTKIVDLKDGVFEGVTASTVILVLEASRPNKDNLIEI